MLNLVEIRSDKCSFSCDVYTLTNNFLNVSERKKITKSPLMNGSLDDHVQSRCDRSLSLLSRGLHGPLYGISSTKPSISAPFDRKDPVCRSGPIIEGPLRVTHVTGSHSYFSKIIYPNQNPTASLCSLRWNLQNKIIHGWFIFMELLLNKTIEFSSHHGNILFRKQ